MNLSAKTRNMEKKLRIANRARLRILWKSESGEEVKYIMNKRWQRWRALSILALIIVQALIGVRTGTAQTITNTTVNAITTIKDARPVAQSERSSFGTHYIDSANGMTVDDAVAYALRHNAELLAVRAEVEAARALVRQAGLRPNPELEASGSRQILGPDNSLMVSARLPLELGGRRAARITVAERELEVRESSVADRERVLAAEVRAKFGATLAEVSKLGFTEALLAATRRNQQLIVARVVEGRTAPLEENISLVEVNRLRSLRETSEGRVEVAMLELRNALGMQPQEPLRLRGDFARMFADLPPLAAAIEVALRERPDLRAMRAMESLAAAQIGQARTEGRLDAGLMVGYQRMNSSFPVQGISEGGALRPVQDVFHFVTFGVSLNLPVRNRNQGAIEAAVAGEEATRRRREFAELTVRREVAAAYARYESAARALEVFRVGVRGQANQNLDVIRQTYELGARTLLDYIAEQRRFIEVETGYIDAALDAYLARVEIMRATAAVSPESITR